MGWEGEIESEPDGSATSACTASGPDLGSDPLGLVGLLEGATKALAVDPTLESDEALMAAAVGLEDLRNLVEAASARLLGRLEATGATDVAIGMRTAGWLAWEADASRSRCRSRVGIARRLGWFDEFDTALVDRRVSFAHADVLCAVANPRNRAGLSAVQGSLVDLAARVPFEEWAALVRQLGRDLDEDGSFDPNEDLDANRLRIDPVGDGTAAVSGQLTGDTAVTVAQTLESVADELFERFRRDAGVDPELPMPSRSTLLALALGEVCRRAKATDLTSARQPKVEATVVITETPDGAAVSGVAGDRVSGFAADVLLADPELRGALFDGDGVPLRLGRRVRLATADQKHLLALRDRGCVFPGCDASPGWCDAHHQPGWARGGSTDIDRMFLLCRHHHVVTHRHGWACEPDPDRTHHWRWTTPAGRIVHSETNGPPGAGLRPPGPG